MPPDMYSARVVVSATARAFSAASVAAVAARVACFLGEDELHERGLRTVVTLARLLDLQLQLADLGLELASLGLGVGEWVGYAPRGEHARCRRRSCDQTRVPEAALPPAAKDRGHARHGGHQDEGGRRDPAARSCRRVRFARTLDDDDRPRPHRADVANKQGRCVALKLEMHGAVGADGEAVRQHGLVVLGRRVLRCEQCRCERTLVADPRSCGGDGCGVGVVLAR